MVDLHWIRFYGYGFMSITVCFINICICRLQFVLTCRERGFFLSGAEIFVSVCSFIQLWSQYYSLHVCFLFFVVIFLDSTNNFVITLFICMKCVSGLFKSLKMCKLFNQQKVHQYIFSIHRK